MLTETQCKSADAGGNKIAKLHDGRGLYLWVFDNGRKYWRFRYKTAGVEKSLSLGTYPDISLRIARLKCDEARASFELGDDPALIRRKEKTIRHLSKAHSFKAVAEEWATRQSHLWVKTHFAEVRRRLDNNLYPALGSIPISEIDAPMLLGVLRVIEKRGAYDLAHRVLQMCGQVFRYAIATGRCKQDISKDLRGALTPHREKHQPAISPEELPELLQAINRYGATGERSTVLALQLICLTFVRTRELIEADVSEFDLKKKMWKIPAERMKMRYEHYVPLSRQAISIIDELLALKPFDSKFLFPGRNPDKPISNNTMLFALYRMGYKGKMTGHGFRSVASTILNEQGFRSDVIERQLAHGEKDGVRAAYNRAEYKTERTEMMQWWADYLDGLKAA